MKKASLIVLLITAYWIVRVTYAPPVEFVPPTADELQAMDAEHMGQQDWGSILEQHADDGLSGMADVSDF